MNNESDFIRRLQDPILKDAAFRELLGHYKVRLYWHIRKIVLIHDDANDVTQNTFIKVYQNINKFKGNSKLYSWLYRIATNESLTHLKKKAKRLQITNTDYITRTINNLPADVYFEGDEIQLKLQRAIGTLPEKQRLVFNMKYFENFKYKEMSTILDTSEGALKASYHLAVKKIKAFLTRN